MEIKNLKPRLYQEKIFHTATKKNTLVILPTGLGKTLIALMLSTYVLNKNPDSKILFLAPTKPLCQQHFSTFEKNSDSNHKFSILTGATKPEERKKMWKDSSIIFATPQTISNDVISGKIKLENVSLMIFDEAHRAVGDYDYVFLAKDYSKNKNPKILGLTASPGSDKEYINKIKENLFVDSVEIRHEKSKDVLPYVEKRDVRKIFIELPQKFKELKSIMEDCLKRRLKSLKEKGLVETYDVNKIRKSKLLKTQSKTAKPGKYSGRKQEKRAISKSEDQ